MGIRAQECVAAELGARQGPWSPSGTGAFVHCSAWSLEHVVRPVEPGAVQSEQLQCTGAAPIELLQAPLDVLHAPGSKKFGIFTLQAEISFSRALMEIVCLVNPNN